jgi:hypothetical protein
MGKRPLEGRGRTRHGHRFGLELFLSLPVFKLPESTPPTPPFSHSSKAAASDSLTIGFSIFAAAAAAVFLVCVVFCVAKRQKTREVELRPTDYDHHPSLKVTRQELSVSDSKD